MSHAMLSQLATIVDGELYGEDEGFDGVSTDSRTLHPGELFIALKGPNFDGNQFIAEAAAQGAAGALVETLSDCDLPQVRVDDALAALGAFACLWRRSLDLRLVAVTGSNGKTTVKEMIASILRRVGPTFATSGNLNNEIGVPLSLLSLRPEHALAVIEMGANHANEIAKLTAMAAPDIGLITNAAPAHLEGFGSIQGVATAKGELFEGLQRNGIAIINRDDQFYAQWRKSTRAQKVISFGRHAEADFQVTDVVQYTNGHGDGVRLDLRTPDGSRQVKLPVPGQHNAINAAAAAAASWAAGADLDDIVAGLWGIRPVPGRLAIRPTRFGARLIDDTYNANPASMQVALDFLAAQPGSAWLVLGDMGELGEEATELHALIGTRAREAGVERLFALGPLSAAAAASFGPGAQQFGDAEQLIAALENELRSGVNVLVKASRAMRMERVTNALSDTEGQA